MKSTTNTLKKNGEDKSLQHSEQLKLQTNAQEQENNNPYSKIVEKEHVEGTPFDIVNVQEKGWFLAMGQHRLTEPITNKNALLQSIDNLPWDILMNMVMIAAEYVIMSHENNTLKNKD